MAAIYWTLSRLFYGSVSAPSHGVLQRRRQIDPASNLAINMAVAYIPQTEDVELPHPHIAADQASCLEQSYLITS